MCPRAKSVTAAVLDIDPEEAVAQVVAELREIVLRRLRRRGAVLGLSGGIDSTVTAALCSEAFGPGKVVGVLMPEADSDPETLALSRLAAESVGIETVVEDITGILEATGCYRRRDEAFRSVIPEFADGWRAKIVLPSILGGDRLAVFSVVAEAPSGERFQTRLSAAAYRGVLAATSFKQRTRKMLEYYHADRLDYAVVGTPNRLEYDQGFFVKQGDGAADVKPIAHLYKTQVYLLAEHFGVPAEIRARPPTTDTYSLPQSQEEFYFSLPYDKMDLCLYARDNDLPAEAVAEACELAPEDVERVFRDIDRKREVTRYLHEPPLLAEPVPALSRP